MRRKLRKMNDHLSNYEIEAKVIKRYLLVKSFHTKDIDLYIKAMNKEAISNYGKSKIKYKLEELRRD